MANNVTAYGRQQVEWPDLGSDPGVTLHGQIVAAVGYLSNNITGRWSGSQTFEIGQTIQIEHNFGQSVASLKIIVTELGVPLLDSVISTVLQISQVDTNTISVQNISGSVKTYQIYVYPHKQNIVDSEINTGVSGSKIVPNFGSQNVLTTGTVSGSNFLGTNLGQSGDTSMKNIHGYGRVVSPQQTASAAGNETLDCSQKHIFLKTGGNAAITLTNLSEGQTAIVVLNSTGSAYTITWSPTIKWSNLSAPTASISANVKDVYTFIKIGGDIYGAATLNMG